jgi:glycosyltransferase involved in cell wall biosynthesis
MRILHVVPTYAPAWKHGGPIRAVHGLCKALAARGHEVAVFTTDVDTGGTVPATGEPVRLDGVSVHYFPVRLRRLYDSPAMKRALEEKVGEFDVVHLHSVFLRPTALAARTAEKAGVPYLLAPRGMLVPDLLRRRGRWRKALWLRLVERRTLAKAAGLHATSALEAAEVARLGLPLPPVFLVPNGVEPEPYLPGTPVSAPVRRLLDGGPFLLFLGRLSWKKGLDRLIPALVHVPGALLAVAGNDEEGIRPKLERLAAENGVAGRVVFLGPVEGDDKTALLHRAYALVLSSYSENFGNAVLESMAAGRPVVVTPAVGLAGVVRESGAGIVVDGDPERLGAALREVLADPERADEMGRRGAQAAARRFGWDAVAAEMEAVYERMVLIGQPGAPDRPLPLAPSPVRPPSHPPRTGEGETPMERELGTAPSNSGGGAPLPLGVEGGGTRGGGDGGGGGRGAARPGLRLAFVVERPTQFEVPFYRHAAADPANRLRVIYTDPRCGDEVLDPELGRTVSWGFPLLGGYEHAVCPPAGRREWLDRELRREPLDLVIVNGYTRRPYVLAALAARRAGIATGLRLDSVLWDGRPSRALARRLLFALGLTRIFDLFFAAGTLTLDYLRFFGVPAERTALFPYAVDVEAFHRASSLSPQERGAVRDRIGVPRGARVLLAVTKLSPREAPWDLLRACARSHAADRWLVIAGDGPARSELETFARDQGLARVRFLGYVPYAQLPALYAAADLFLHPVQEERWGVSVAEALACGLPVVTSSRVGAARDLLAVGRNGFTYPAGDDAALAERIEEALRLDAAAVREESRAVLARWDYAATWRGLLAAAARVSERRP